MKHINEILDRILVFVASVWLTTESIYCFRQLSGHVHSNSVRYLMTGHFRNPGPLGGFISVLFCITAAYSMSMRLRSDKKPVDRILMYISAFASVAGGILLPATQSRIALAGVAVAAVVYLYNNWGKLGIKFPARRFAALLSIALVVTGGLLFMLKKDSAIGRFHIWQIETRVIADHPLKGVGSGMALGAYGLEQAEYFGEKDRPAVLKRVAGCPEYAFNEYLRIGMEHGIPAMVAFIFITLAVILVLLKRDSCFAYGALSLAVFAVASYPFSLGYFKLIGLCLVGLTAVSLCKRPYVGILTLGVATATVICAQHRGYLSDDKQEFRDIYEIAHSLFEQGKYEDALQELKLGAAISSDPMFHNIMGRCYQALGEYDAAASEYRLSHMMVPSRLYPLVLLKEMYEYLGDTASAEAVSKEIESIPINPDNPNMVQLKERAENGTI